MSADRALYVFAYDIGADRARERVADVLGERLARVQLSVFEGRITRREAMDLVASLRRHVGPGDKLRVYCVPIAALAECMSVGGAPVPEQQEFWLL